MTLSRRQFLGSAITLVGAAGPRAITDARTLPDLAQIVFLGQSNAGGADALPLVTTNASHGASLRFSCGVRTWRAMHAGAPALRSQADFALVPLIETREARAGETGASGMSRHLERELRAAVDSGGTRPRILVNYPHHGGKNLVQLDFRDLGQGGFHATYVDDIKRAHLEAARRGWSHEVLALRLVQGENEGAGRLIPKGPRLPWAKFLADYASDLVAAHARWQSDARLITGQAGTIPLLISQVANDWAGMAQLQAAQQAAGIHVVGPIYQVPSARNSRLPGGRGSGTHLSADGQRWLGEQVGKVLSRILLFGENWTPLEPSEIEIVSTTELRIRFKVPRPPLVWDTKWLPIAKDYGFRIQFGARDAPGRRCRIDDVEIAASDEVRLRLAAATPLVRGETFTLRYGSSPIVGPTPVPIQEVRNGAAFPNGEASLEIAFQGDVMDAFTPLLEEGAFMLRQSELGNASLVVRNARTEGGLTIVQGELREMRGRFVRGAKALIARDRSFGNLADSDDARSVFSFGDPSYGSRAGMPYPLHNHCVVFTRELTA